MKQRNNWFITGGLYLLLIFLAVKVVYVAYNYYTGPLRVVEVYTNALQQGEYEKAYKLLNDESLDSLVTEKQMIDYYRQIYTNRLLYVKNVGNMHFQGKNNARCKVVYSFKNESKEDYLQLVYNHNRWEIVAPFKSSSVTIYAPAISQVYINGKKVLNQNEGMFKENGLLPGNYMLQVSFPNTKYKDYHQVIKLPEQSEVILPYDMVNIGIKTIKGMEVSLGGFQKVATKPQINFNDILPGEYTLMIKSPYDTITPITETVTIGDTSCNLNYDEVTLSITGKKAWKDFINNFYNDYLTGIKTQEVNCIKGYFKGYIQQEQLKLFDDWFIKDKEIQHAQLQVESELGNITQEGYLNVQTMEIVELTNHEDIEGSMENRIYRVVLNWDMQVDIMKEQWQIVDRRLKESIIAYQTEDGRWIQY